MSAILRRRQPIGPIVRVAIAPVIKVKNAMGTPVKVGDRAPDFTLTSAAGTPVSLSQVLSQKPVVLYFYPKDDTPGCTAEACSFRDNFNEFETLGAEILGVSGDSVESHQSFQRRHNLPFQLLSDVGNRVRQLYGVPATLGILPGRVTYVIDRQGIVRHIFNSQLNFNAHIQEALAALKRLDHSTDAAP